MKNYRALCVFALSGICMPAVNTIQHIKKDVVQKETWKSLNKKLIKDTCRNKWTISLPSWRSLACMVGTTINFRGYVSEKRNASNYAEKWAKSNASRGGFALSNFEKSASIKFDELIFSFAITICTLVSEMISIENSEKEAFLHVLNGWIMGKCEIPTELLPLFQEARMLLLQHPNRLRRKLPTIIKAAKEKISSHVKKA